MMAKYVNGVDGSRPLHEVGRCTMISGYLGNSSKFDKAIASFGMTYADQNERDYQAFLKAIRAGKIEVYNE